MLVRMQRAEIGVVLMEEILKQILGKVEKLERLERLEPLVEESHQWIRILVENKEVHKAEIDNVKNDLARVEGVLVGFDKSLDAMKKAQ